MWLKIMQNSIRIYIVGGIVSVIMLTLSLQPVMGWKFETSLLDAVFFTAWLLVLIFAMLNVLKFGNFGLVPISVRLVIFLLLGGFTSLLLLAGTYYLEINFFKDLPEKQFVSLFGFKLTYSFLLFLLANLYMNRNRVEDRDESYSSAEMQSEKIEMKAEEKSQRPVNPEFQERITAKTGSKIHIVPVTEVICLLADGDYVQVISEKGKYLKEQTMKYFELNLPENQFVRVHRSCIVNINSISRIEVYDKQNFSLLLKNGEKVKVSQAGYKLLREKLNFNVKK